MATTKVSTSVFSYRLRPPAGLEKTLMKELKLLNIGVTPKKVPGRKIIEIMGPQDILWEIMFKSRIAEDIQVRMTQQFVARGDKELRTNLQKLPWHCYLPNESQKGDLMFKMPRTSAKTFKSKLYHTQMVREILIEEITDMQIRKDFKKAVRERGVPYKHFKKEWLAKRQALEQKEIEKMVSDKLGKSDQESAQQQEEDDESKKSKSVKGLDEVKAELKASREFQKNLRDISRIQINIVKDRAEILIGTSNDELHKHGYKPFVRWGVLKETLTAACILESGIIANALKTGKLYLWDPFCGSGSFPIETIMMLLEQPVRNFEEQLPFEYWPIHQKEKFEQYKEDMNDFAKMRKRNEIDIQIIGSDISQKAIETSSKNVEYADIQKLCEQDLVTPRTHKFLNSPLIYSQHYPKPSQVSSDGSSSRSLINFKDTEKPLIMSLYHGDFRDIGLKLADLTDSFKDFQILTNVPYGMQSREKMHQTDTDLQNFYRRFGRFLLQYPSLEFNTYVVAQSHHYGHKLSFEKFSNCGWKKEISFNNGGIGVHLLQLDMSQISEVKQTVQAYKEISAS